MPVLRALPWALWAALALFSVATYTTLPEMIPRHFDAAGNPTAMMQRSPWSWAMIPIIALVTQVGIAWTAAVLPRKPHLFNFSDKERFLRIPAAYQGPVIEKMREMLDITGAFTVLVFATVQVMVWRSAMGHAADGMSLGLILVTVMFTPAILILISRVNTAVEEAEKRWKSAEGEARGR
ncbi:MAG TPA: DUF1648 domain-containing protein [Gemmatimonadaceae bacterium]|nr:DUF1648 domain-containing protein [Gemmatimonadaceae bacterium]